MNPVAEEIESYIGSSSMSGKDFLEHYGIRRRSGRYPWGSGKDPYQSGRDFIGRVEEMRKSGFTYTERNGPEIRLLQNHLDILLPILERSMPLRKMNVDQTWLLQLDV